MSSIKQVVVTDYIEDDLEWEREQLADHDIELKTFQLKGKPEEEVFEAVKEADVIVVNMVPMTASLLSRLDRCRAIIRHGIGYDNVDVEACTENGIQFANQPDYCATDVAEHAISLIMAYGRRLFPARKSLEVSSAAGEWNFEGLFPIHRLEGQTVGIVGLGRIGSIVARKLSGFGFRLVAADPYIEDTVFEQAGVEKMELNDLLAESDFVTIHTPLSKETRHLINKETLSRMKPTGCLINTARGPIVDAGALADALKKGKIGGAAIDVYSDEPPSPDYPLFEMENVLLTPHSGWASEESSLAIRKKILDDILSLARGENARHLINDIRFNG